MISRGVRWRNRQEATGIMQVIQMIELHTIDFSRVGFNVGGDADRGTITL